MDRNSDPDNGGHTGGLQHLSTLCVPVLFGQRHMGLDRRTVARELFDSFECGIDHNLCGGTDIWVKKVNEYATFCQVDAITIRAILNYNKGVE